MLKLKWNFVALVCMTLLLGACHAEPVNYYTGTVESDRYTAMTTHSGEITEILVDEGDLVKTGDMIASLDTESLDIEIQRLSALLAGAQADLAKVLKGAREEEVNQIYRQIEQQKDQIEIFQDQLNHAFDSYNTVKTLVDSGAAPKKDLDDAQLIKDNAVTKRDQAKAQKGLLEEQLSLILQGATEEEMLSAQSRVDSAKWAVASIEKKKKDAKILANHDGVVESLYFNEGEQYTALSKMAQIIDIELIKVRIYIEEKNLNQVQVGDKVTVKVDYDTSLNLEGVVEFMSSSGEFTPKNLESKENRQEVVYETRIRINNADRLLKPGMLVDIYLGDDVNE